MQAVKERELEAIHRLERTYSIDLRAYGTPPPGAPGGEPPLVHGSVVNTGLSVASGLRHLGVKYSAMPTIGVIVCEPQHLTAWVAKRCELLSICCMADPQGL